jgi:SsrA-binding protein
MVGISLTGPEVKSVRLGNIRLEDSYVKILEGAPILVNAEIAQYRFSSEKQDIRRTRKLLLSKKEILKIETTLHAGGNLTIIPLACYNKKKYIKIEIAIAKGKKTWQVKRVEKERDEKRREQREAKEY